MLLLRSGAILLAATLLAVVLAATPLLRQVAPASACSVLLPLLDELPTRTTGVVLVEVVSAGGAINGTAPLPLRTPAAPLATATPEERSSVEIPDLTGYGAQLQVVEVLAGSVPAQVDVDTARRRQLEQTIRSYERVAEELRLGLYDVRQGIPIPPCPLSLGVHRYDAGQRYLVFLDYGGGNWTTNIKYRLEGEQLVTFTQATLTEMGAPLYVGDDLRERFFAGLPSEPLGTDFWHIEVVRLPLQTMRNVIRYVLDPRAVEPPAASLTAVPPIVTPPVERPIIRPPETGSAGLLGR